ncbi:MAG: penicillin-binding protein 2 [Candidatus Nitrotoga sp.]
MNHRVELKDSQREIHHFRLRLMLCVSIVLLMFFLLLVRFVYLQVIKHSHYETLAENNRISIVPIVPSRGVIRDRNGEVLARNYSGYTLEITPSKVNDMEGLINQLALLVDISNKDRKRFKKLLTESRNFNSLPIRNRLTDVEVARMAAQVFRFPGVEIKARLFREYPHRELTSHFIGYISRINDEDLKIIEESNENSNYLGTDYIGKIGIEQSYEKELHGITGIQRVEVDSAGREVRTVSSTAPISGNDLTLTLDVKLQSVTEQAFGDYRGAMVAIDPSNGEVLAFVSKPGYDPNLFIDGIDEQSWNELSNSLDVPLNNRALRGQYPPGSTIKPFMALAGLTYNTRTPTKTISDPGFFTLPGNRHRYRDWKQDGHGIVDLFKSIVISCDTYYYGLATEMGIGNIASFLSQFGFGKQTGIDLEGEVSGLLPSEEWKQRRYQQIWYPGDTVSVGIGQGYSLVTPLQLAAATAALANNGILHRPHLVKKIERNSNNAASATTASQAVQQINLKAEHLDLVKRAMIAVTKPGGTAAWAGNGVPYVMAGKTGTAQVINIKQGEKYDAQKVDERHRDHAWFIAFAPAEQPKIALVVLVENGGHGSSTAAPIARKVLDYFMLGKVPKPLVKTKMGGDVEGD